MHCMTRHQSALRQKVCKLLIFGSYCCFGSLTLMCYPGAD
ncbi:unnamed protein product [Staurois parvus]|uniref:Uncharacterized protein n=1 Tax=Staurois parvus TaxID=386267 RepID=A0ABN9GT29_9NEOB|nr:unnamed protein product [Staurois parvus]